MPEGDASRITVGSCSSCGRTLRVKPRGLRRSVRLTCKCGHVNNVDVDKATLSEHGVTRVPVPHDIYQTPGAPLYRLLDGPRLRAAWAEDDARHAERWGDQPADSRPANLSDIISVSVNPYVSEANARAAVKTLVGRLRNMGAARPWSVELFENVDCATDGMLDAPYFVVLGMTEIGCSGEKTYGALKQITYDLWSDDARARSGGEWEVWSQNRGNQWRGDRCAKLLERWVFLDVDTIRTFEIRQPSR